MTKKILLIEDEVLIYEIYVKVMQKHGYEVAIARDGQEALDILQQRQDFDLILLDIMLPKVNGIDVLQRIREGLGTRHIPVWLLTNLGQKNIIEKAQRLGIDRYLMKSKYLPSEIVTLLDQFFLQEKE